ncbi:MAG: four helix bundle protein [Sedimentisphaerales bacterium]|nr:four helix bundle protein [Sedimentisphaerales bacterium]
MAKSVIKGKSYDFALRIVKLCMQLRDNRHFEIASQLLKAGTSIGANVEEALAGQSRKDFFAKMSISSKEARESRYWLRLIRDAEIFDKQQIQELIDECEELIKILTSIVKTGSDEGKPLRRT